MDAQLAVMHTPALTYCATAVTLAVLGITAALLQTLSTYAYVTCINRADNIIHNTNSACQPGLGAHGASLSSPGRLVLSDLDRGGT